MHLYIHKSSPYPELVDPVHIFTSYISEIHFNVILLPMERSSKWSLPLRIPEQNFVCVPQSNLDRKSNIYIRSLFSVSKQNQTKHCSWVVRTPVSYTEHSGIHSWPGGLLSWLRTLMVFLNPCIALYVSYSKKMSRKHFHYRRVLALSNSRKGVDL
jgi:hypothetical protein